MGGGWSLHPEKYGQKTDQSLEMRHTGDDLVATMICKSGRTMALQVQSETYPGPQTSFSIGHTASTVDQPAASPIHIFVREGQSAGFASVETRSMNIRGG